MPAAPLLPVVLACQALAALSPTTTTTTADAAAAADAPPTHPRKRARSSAAAARPPPPHAALLAENAQRMVALAEQGLGVVQAMMALEAETRAAADLECWVCAPEDDHTLEDACVALGTAHRRATQRALSLAP
jgi:hypothetical protein